MRSAGGKPPDLSHSHRCQPACVSVRIAGGDAKALFACRGAGCPAGIRRNESFIVDRAECSIADRESAVISDNFFGVDGVRYCIVEGDPGIKILTFMARRRPEFCAVR